MTTKQVWIAVGAAVAVVGFGYLATRREINATVTAGVAELTYRAGGGGQAGAPTAQERPSNAPHEDVLDAIDTSNEAIQDYVVPSNPWGIS